MDAGHRAFLASSARPSSRSTRVMTAGASRGKASNPHAGHFRGPLVGGFLGRLSAPPAEAVGAGPLDQLHRPAGERPGDVLGRCSEGHEVGVGGRGVGPEQDADVEAVVGVHGPAGAAAEQPQEDAPLVVSHLGQGDRRAQHGDDEGGSIGDAGTMGRDERAHPRMVAEPRHAAPPPGIRAGAIGGARGSLRWRHGPADADDGSPRAASVGDGRPGRALRLTPRSRSGITRTVGAGRGARPRRSWNGRSSAVETGAWPSRRSSSPTPVLWRAGRACRSRRSCPRSSPPWRSRCWRLGERHRGHGYAEAEAGRAAAIGYGFDDLGLDAIVSIYQPA